MSPVQYKVSAFETQRQAFQYRVSPHRALMTFRLQQRGGSLPAPWYRQFDAYRQCWLRRYLPDGNRFPAQRLKIALVRRAFQCNGLWKDMSRMVPG